MLELRNTDSVDLRSLAPDLSPIDRIDARRRMIEEKLGIDLDALSIEEAKLGHAEERNCENMFGAVPIPVGLAGPLPITMSDGTETEIYLPLATTEGALVASVNRGCKALRENGSVQTKSTYHGVTRSIALKLQKGQSSERVAVEIRHKEKEWKAIGESTSHHLKFLSYDIDLSEPYVFLTLAADTDEAMGMNMITIAAEAIGIWLAEELGMNLVTVAANVDSDKKPSKRTHDRGRGYEATATCNLQPGTIQSILKTTPEAMREAALAKLDVGSNVAGAIGKNLHAANIIAALYLATGQDAAHVVEGSLTDTIVEKTNEGLSITVHCPALMLGVRGGGTTLPAQSKLLSLLLPQTTLKTPQTLAECIAAAVLAGEISLLAAQASHDLAKAHKILARS